MKSISDKDKTFFTQKLLDWFAESKRPLPWKEETDPYLIWLSEIILQQTRVEQGLPYYQKFVEKYPAVEDLAKADLDEVLKLWEGLGYYSRARNLHFTANYIVDELDGEFPTTFKGLRKLKGVGDYTAAAIASFAYELPHAVVDGNVYRVLARFFGIDTPINTTQAKKEFSQLANELLDESLPSRYNQAIMDFGAIHCKPRKPRCPTCLHKEHCVAFQEKLVYELPKKKKAKKKKNRFFYYLVLNHKNKVQLRQRIDKDIWQGLYDFPMIETPKITNLDDLTQTEAWEKIFDGQQFYISKVSKGYKQTLSHQNIVAIFVEIKLLDKFFLQAENLQVIKRSKIKSFAFPKVVSTYLNDNKLYLDI